MYLSRRARYFKTCRTTTLFQPSFGLSFLAQLQFKIWLQSVHCCLGNKLHCYGNCNAGAIFGRVSADNFRKRAQWLKLLSRFNKLFFTQRLEMGNAKETRSARAASYCHSRTKKTTLGVKARAVKMNLVCRWSSHLCARYFMTPSTTNVGLLHVAASIQNQSAWLVAISDLTDFGLGPNAIQSRTWRRTCKLATGLGPYSGNRSFR